MRLENAPLRVPARTTMQNLPARLDKPLFLPQASRLARELRKLLVATRLEQDAAAPD